MLPVLLLGVLGSGALGLPALPQPKPHGSQCIGQDCFALFRAPETFFAASQVCESLRGHLMTVRSSVAVDVISLLLSGGGGGESPSFWIGLKLPPGCSDPGHLGPLRGFQWVTGDNSTSYSGWERLHEAPAPLCGPLCVAVSEAGVPARGEPSWEERQCTTTADGFLCEFHFPASCKPLSVGSGDLATASISVNYSTPFRARGADFQALPLGSSAEVAPFGVELVCELRPGEAEGRWGRDKPGAWDCGVENGGCEHVCNGSAGESHCLCPANTTPEADGRSCTAAKEDLCDKRCHHLCHRNPDVPSGYSCMCDVGYKLAEDQHRCEDVNDCLQVPSLCPQICVNTEGSFECRCNPGFDLVNGECVEAVDLCLRNNCEYQCQPLTATESPPYRCICAEGFAPIPHAPHRCQLFCNQTECPADCNPDCRCPEGYILDEGSMCTDIDECANGNCINAVSCKNLPGTYECNCGPDMVNTGSDCDPITVDGGSGEPPVSPTPGVTLSPKPAGSVHSGVLIGISISSLCLVVALLTLLCHLRKKQGAMQAELEYKCGVPSKEVVLQHVPTEQMPQKL